MTRRFSANTGELDGPPDAARLSSVLPALASGVFTIQTQYGIVRTSWKVVLRLARSGEHDGLEAFS